MRRYVALHTVQIIASLALMVTSFTLMQQVVHAEDKDMAPLSISANIDIEPAAAPALDLRYTDQFTYIWEYNHTFLRLNGRYTGVFAKPDVPPGYFPLAHFGLGSSHTPPSYSLVAKELIPGALAKPMDFEPLWFTAGSIAENDGSFWRPVPPPGYACLSDVMQAGESKPALDTIYCIRKDLTAPGKTGGFVWNNEKMQVDSEITLWHVLPEDELSGIGLNAFIGVKHFGEFDVNDRNLYTIKTSAVAKPDLAAGLFDSLISKYGPRLVLHSDEKYMPDDPSEILNFNAELCSGVVHGEKDKYESEQDLWDYGYDHMVCVETNANDLLDDVYIAQQRSYASDPNFKIWLDTDPRANSGDLSRAKAFVRVLPGDQVFLEVQFWIYYPYNGPGKAYIQIGPLDDFHMQYDGLGRHSGDWESVRIRFAKDAFGDDSFKVAQVIMSRHGDEIMYQATDPRLELYKGTHPVVYSARDSHAMYPNAAVQYYERKAHEYKWYCSCTIDVDLEDWTSISERTLDLFYLSNYQIVSSEWPSVAADPPDWLSFEGRWGKFERLGQYVNYADLHTEFTAEIGNGPTGPAQKGIWPYINDSTPPVVTSNVVGTLGNAPWYITNPDISWTVDDPESDVTKTGCEPAVQFSDTDGYLHFCLAKSAGGSTYKSVGVKVDKAKPSITASLIPAPNGYGWNNTSVTVHFECTDSTSGVAFCSPDATYSGEYFDTYGWTSFSMGGTARDNAGHTRDTITPPIRIDMDAPALTFFSPQVKNYGNTTSLSFNWIAADDLSGIAAEVALLDATPMTNGQVVSAATLALGNHTASVTVTDWAGNGTTKSVNFTIVNGAGDNIVPIFTSTPETHVNFQQTYRYSISTTDANLSDPMTISAVQKPVWLTLTDNGNGTGKLEGYMDNSTVGEHDIILKVQDSAGASTDQSFTLKITGFVLFKNNQAPTPADDTTSVNFNSEQNSINVLQNDTDPNSDPLIVTAVSQPKKGTTAFADGEILYWPETGVSGTDIFTYTVSDEDDTQPLTASATVTVTIQDGPDNRAPITVDDTKDVDFASSRNSISVLDNDSDPDGDTLLLTDVGSAAHGVAYVLGDIIRYTPDPYYSGPDSFTYRIEDGRGGTKTATVSINVADDPTPKPNSVPFAFNDTYTVTVGSKDNNVNVLSNDGDLDDDSLSITEVSAPENGVAKVSNSQILYTPTAGFKGTDNFTYTASDGKGGTDAATVTVVVGESGDSGQSTYLPAIRSSTDANAAGTGD